MVSIYWLPQVTFTVTSFMVLVTPKTPVTPNFQNFSIFLFSINFYFLIFFLKNKLKNEVTGVTPP
jgi:hypothetical protein